MNELTI